MVVEADESDGSFLRLPAVIAVVTNMDPEHLDHWGTPEAMVAGYDQFVGNVPFYGFAVLCIDHPGGAADDPAPVGPAHHHLRLLAAGRCARRPRGARQAWLDLRRHRHRPRAQPLAQAGSVPAADAGRSTTCRTRWRRWRSASRWRSTTTRCVARSQVSGREAALHQDRRSGRHHGDRRLRPPSGGDRRGAEGGAPGRRARRDRGGAAASLLRGCIRCSTSSAPA